MNEQTKYSGIPFWFDGREYVIPPLSPRQMKELRDVIKKAADTPMNSGLDLGDLITERFVPVIHAAMTRNYPELTVEQVTDFIDLDTFGLAYGAAMGRRAYEAALKRSQSLDLSVGEATPVAEKKQLVDGAESTGQPSTGALPQ